MDLELIHQNCKKLTIVKIRKTLQKLVKKNYVTLHGNMWSLTDEGFKTASNLYNQQSRHE